MLNPLIRYVLLIAVASVSVAISPARAQQPADPPSQAAQAIPTTVTVSPGQPLPIRQWVQRPLPYQGPWSDSAVLPPPEARALPASKHTKVFYQPGLKAMVIAGGDRAVSMPRGGAGDGTGTGLISLEVAHDRWATVRPFCVPGEPQPGCPDNVVWALDKKRNRALMAPGFCFITQGTGSDCGAVDGWGGYAFDFATKKFIGPDDPTIMVPPPGGWGGDEVVPFGLVDSVKDELVKANSPGLGPSQKWTVVDGAFRVVNQHCNVATDQQWSSASAEADLPSADMEVWATSVQLDVSGTYTIELQMGVATGAYRWVLDDWRAASSANSAR